MARSLFTVAVIAALLALGCYPTPDLTADGSDEGPATKMQNGFSWVLEDRLAGMPRPGVDGDLQGDVSFLADRKIDLLVSLTEPPTSEEVLSQHGISLLHLPVRDFHPPTLEQLTTFVTAARPLISKGGKVGVHCAAGKGRTGTFLAAYLVSEGMDADEAIAEVRRLRPGSIETAAQEQAVREYEQSLQGS